jgi:hypothetical protein
MSAVDDLSRRAILRAVPFGLEWRFDAAAAGELEAVIELRVTDSDRRRGARFAIVVGGGRCEVRRRPAPESGAQVSIPALDAVRLLAGAEPWPALLADGRLTLSGEPFLALRFPTLFGFARSR